MDEELAAVTKEIATVAEEISKQTSKIEDIETLLAKDFTEWSGREKNLYGTIEQEARKALREKDNQLRDKDNQLREKDNQLREKERELLKQKTILLEEASSSGVRRLPAPFDLSVNNAFSIPNYDWSNLSKLFIEVKPFVETTMVVESDRQYKFVSKPVVFFKNDQWSLLKGRLPDLRFQSIDVGTKIQQSVKRFMDGNEFLGLLIGPTGCGKTHELLTCAKSQFTIFIDAQSYPATSEPNDVSLSSLKHSLETVTSRWLKRNQDLAQLRTIAYAFTLSRMLFLKFLRERHPALTPTQFLIHQFFNSRAIENCFASLSLLPFQNLIRIRNLLVDFRCLFCVDEAHVLVAHLDDKIISSMEGTHTQQNGDVNETSKRGTLSVLLHAIKEGQFAKKVILAGTSSKLRNIDNFGTFETKPIAPTVMSQFSAWTPQMALEYVSSFVDVSHSDLEKVLIDNYRPRILENFVYDLFCIAMNDNESPKTKDERIEKRGGFEDLSEILKESYDAIINRFTRVSIVQAARAINNSGYTSTILKLLLSSMMGTRDRPINCQLDDTQTNFFTDTVGSIYLIYGLGGYTFYEGYVIDAFLDLFKEDLAKHKLSAALDLVKNLIGLEGRKSSAKGTPFEAVVLADLVKLNGPSLSKVLLDFGVRVDTNLNNLHLPVFESKMDDAAIISKRPLNVFLRPSNQFRPDILAFLSNQVCISFGIKFYTSRIPAPLHNDNCESTDPDLFFSKAGKPTNLEKCRLWGESLLEKPVTFSARFLIELPEPASTVSTDTIHKVAAANRRESVIVVITKHNMRQLISEDVASLVDFITQ